MGCDLSNVYLVVKALSGARLKVANFEKGILLIRGAVPGSRGSDVVIRPAVKAIAMEGL